MKGKKCPLCSSGSDFFAADKVLNKYQVAYFKCGNCGLVQTEKPYWLKEAYVDTISKSDVGLVSRNLAMAKITKTIIYAFFDRKSKYVDYGGGYGLFVRLMRDSGFNFYWYDKFCANLFANDYEVMNCNGPFELVTAFEVFEHLYSPLDEVKKMCALSKNILFTTQLLPANSPKPGEWQYYALDHGQHISFYTFKSLSIIAEKLSLNLYSNGQCIHLLTSKKISNAILTIASIHKIASWFDFIFKQKSLIKDDYFKITGKRFY